MPKEVPGFKNESINDDCAVPTEAGSAPSSAEKSSGHVKGKGARPTRKTKKTKPCGTMMDSMPESAASLEELQAKTTDLITNRGFVSTKGVHYYAPRKRFPGQGARKAVRDDSLN